MRQGQPLFTILAVNPPHLLAPEFVEALALMSIGLTLDRKANGGSVCEFVERVKDQSERRFEFVFDADSKVDGFGFSEWQQRWRSETWMAQNPGHPLRAFRMYADNYARFAEWMKTHEKVLVFRNPQSETSERVAYVPERLNDTEEGKKILRGAGISA